MPKSNHATSGSGGSYCGCCASSVGEAVKVQATIIPGEAPWCPRCFVWIRQNRDPGRFNASASIAVRCGFCGWTSVCIGATLGTRLHCGHCQRVGASALPMNNDAHKELAELARAAVERTVVEKAPA